jgi:hypothetical protein
MTRRTLGSLPLAWLALALAACARQGGDAATTPPPTRPAISVPPVETVQPTEAEAVTGEVPSEILDDIVADAAQRTATDPEAVDVVQSVAVTWSDGSLGCPEPGMFYTQALVDGYHVILRAGDEELDYRVTAGGGFRLCEGGGRPSG